MMDFDDDDDKDDGDFMSETAVRELMTLCRKLKDEVASSDIERKKLKIDLEKAQSTGKEILARVNVKDEELLLIKYKMNEQQEEHQLRIQRLLEENAKVLNENDMRYRTIVDGLNQSNMEVIDLKNKNDELRKALAIGIEHLEEADLKLIDIERNKHESLLEKDGKSKKQLEWAQKQREDLWQNEITDLQEKCTNLEKGKTLVERRHLLLRQDTKKSSEAAANALDSIQIELDDLRALSGNAAAESAKEIASLKIKIQNILSEKNNQESKMKADLIKAEEHAKRMEGEVRELRQARVTVEQTMKTLSGLAKQLGGEVFVDVSDINENVKDIQYIISNDNSLDHNGNGFRIPDSDDEEEEKEPIEIKLDDNSDNNIESNNPNYPNQESIVQALSQALAVAQKTSEQTMTSRINQLEENLMSKIANATNTNIRKSGISNTTAAAVTNIPRSTSPQQQSDAVGSWYKNRGAELFHSEIPNHTAAPVSLNSNGIPLSPAPASVPSISSSKRDVWQTAEIASGGTSFKLVNGDENRIEGVQERDQILASLSGGNNTNNTTRPQSRGNRMSNATTPLQPERPGQPPASSRNFQGMRQFTT